MRKILIFSALTSLSVTTGALAIGEPLRVSARDLALQPHKVYGKEIEVEMHCAMIGEAQFRCAAPKIRLDLSKISNEDGQAHLQRFCKGKQEAARPRCLVNLRFVSEGGRRDQQGLTQIRARDDTAAVILSRTQSD